MAWFAEDAECAIGLVWPVAAGLGNKFCCLNIST